MKKISNFTIFGAGLGIAFAVFTAVLFFTNHLYLWEALNDIIIGIIIFVISWFYNRILGIERNLQAVEDYLDEKRINDTEVNQHVTNQRKQEQTQNQNNDS